MTAPRAPVHPRAPHRIGQATRGTTGTNRLRRNDRYLAALPALRSARDPLVIDLGFGASAVTTLEMWTRLSRVRSDVEVIGVELDPDRLARAREQLTKVRAGSTSFSPYARVDFRLGGFELGLAEGRRPALVRAMNVLRQYDEHEVRGAWEQIAARLHPEGLLIEGTCDEIGRVSSWLDIDAAGTPRRLTFSLRLAALERPSVVAERLPKALIHHNVPGEPVHRVLSALDASWQRTAPLATFGAQQRWIAAIEALRAEGMPVLGGRSRWRLGEVSVPWSAIAPA